MAASAVTMVSPNIHRRATGSPRRSRSQAVAPSRRRINDRCPSRGAATTKPSETAKKAIAVGNEVKRQRCLVRSRPEPSSGEQSDSEQSVRGAEHRHLPIRAREASVMQLPGRPTRRGRRTAPAVVVRSAKWRQHFQYLQIIRRHSRPDALTQRPESAVRMISRV